MPDRAQPLQCGPLRPAPPWRSCLSASIFSRRFRLYALFGLVCLVFSTTWLVIRIGLMDLPPLGAAGVRYLIASPILFAIARARGLAFPRNTRTWRMLLLLGVTMFTVPFGLIYYAEQTVPSGLTAVLFASHAIFVALLAHFWLKDEPLTPLSVLGVLGGFAGVVLVFWDRMTGHASWLGESAIVLTAAIQAGSAITVRRFARDIPAVILSCVGTAVGAVLLLAGSFLFESGRTWQWSSRSVLAVLYLAVFGSAVAFTVTIYLLHELGANRVAVTVYITPVLALLWGALFLGESVSRWALAGAFLVVGGVWLTNRASAAARKAHPAAAGAAAAVPKAAGAAE